MEDKIDNFLQFKEDLCRTEANIYKMLLVERLRLYAAIISLMSEMNLESFVINDNVFALSEGKQIEFIQTEDGKSLKIILGEASNDIQS